MNAPSTTDRLGAEYGRNLNAALDERGLTVLKFAQLLDTAPNTVYTWLNGRHIPRDETKLDICRILGMTDGRDMFPLLVPAGEEVTP